MYNNERVILFDENDSPYIAHHGVKGQKCGIRRYQNEDGTLTPAGEKRYYGRVDAVQKDIDSFKGLHKGIYSKSGKLLLSEKDVKNSVAALTKQRDSLKRKADARIEKDHDKLKKKSSNDPKAEDIRKKLLKAGAAAALTAVAAYGGYKLYEAYKDKSFDKNSLSKLLKSNGYNALKDINLFGTPDQMYRDHFPKLHFYGGPDSPKNFEGEHALLRVPEKWRSASGGMGLNRPIDTADFDKYEEYGKSALDLYRNRILGYGSGSKGY